MNEERAAVLRHRLRDLKSSAEHLVEHIQQPSIDPQALQEMHAHMAVMDRQIEHFHDSMETAASRWHRDRVMPVTHLGDTLPMSLVVPVVVDCFVDGFLIGVSVALSSNAGIILAAANCLEMAFLGMAYATRLNRCTGSSREARLCALYGPPLVMLLSAGLGSLLGGLSQAVPALFVGFVAFGVVALLFLVCNELLIEARNAQGEDERWWISVNTFIGVYVVLMLSHAF
jgi:zinc transporter ZupT